jgi:hypothetical protein
MKCVQEEKTHKIMRVSDELAESLVKRGTHIYVKRQLWKELVRDVKPVPLDV